MPFRKKNGSSPPSNSDQIELTVDAAYTQAVAFIEASRFQEADQLCTAIIQSYPAHVDAINLLGVIAQKINQHKIAVEQFKKAIVVDNNRADLYFNLATSLLSSGFENDAIKALEVAVDKAPQNSQINNFLASLQQKQRIKRGKNSPNKFKKLFQQGIAEHQNGQLKKAIESYKNALGLEPENTALLSNIGLALHSLGRINDSIEAYQQAIAIQPGHPQANYNLGNILKEQNNNTAAIEHYKVAISAQPNYLEAYDNLGILLKELRNFDEAVKYLNMALSIKPDNSITLYNLGSALYEQGNIAEAIECYKKAIVIDKNYYQAHHNLGTALQSKKELDQAIVSFKNAIRIKPDYANAYSNIGDVLTEQGKLDKAAVYLEKAITIQPTLAQAHNNLAVVLHKQGDLAASVACCQKALAIKPDFAQAFFNMGVALQDQNRLEEAIDSFSKAVSLEKDYEVAHSNLLLCQQYIVEQTLNTIFAVHDNWAKNLLSYEKIEIFNFDHVVSSSKKLRIGLVSSDLGLHPVGYFVAGFIKHHSVQKFATVCYSDRKPDQLTNILQEYSDSWVDSSLMTDDDLAQKIYADRIDILLDLGGHTAKNRLKVFAKRAAPIQITWAGYVGTTGLPTMDYLIADKNYVKVGEDHLYTEKIIRMPDTWVSYTPPPYVPTIKPAKKPDSSLRIMLGNFGNPTKINSKMLEVWAQILKKAPQADLLLIYKGMDTPYTVQRINSVFDSSGVDLSRINIIGHLPHHQLLDKYNEIDIALDTLPYSGGLTSFESLWMGVPVITAYGDTFAGRHSASILNALGLNSLVANDLTEYIQLVVNLSKDQEKLACIKKDLHNKLKCSSLCDHKKFASDLEKEFGRVWQVWCNNNNR
ncbi:MAG: tetratricopeptide repeat protein [Magnetococcales bacterium]|nr:tetratricopeptide repeat protein [Magnetococcales bacterium]